MISISERVRKLDNFAIYFKAFTEGETPDFEASTIYKELVCSKLHFPKVNSSLFIFVIEPPAALSNAAGAEKSQSLGELSPGILKQI